MILVQESVGDPIVPNIGTNLMSVATGAIQLGAVLAPIHGVSTVPVAEDKTAVTQFRVPSTGTPLDIHGFAQYDSEAGKAAREQTRAFLESIDAGKPVITAPDRCPSGNCDFSGGI